MRTADPCFMVPRFSAVLHLPTECASLNSAVALPNSGSILLQWHKDRDIVQPEENTRAWPHSLIFPYEGRNRSQCLGSSFVVWLSWNKQFSHRYFRAVFCERSLPSIFSSYAWQNERGPGCWLPLLHTGHTGEQVWYC